MMLDMEEVMKGTQMVMSIKVNSKKERPTAKESTNGRMVKSMMENGIMGLSKDMECGRDWQETLTLVNGRIPKLMAMESILGKMVTGMKENGKSV